MSQRDHCSHCTHQQILYLGLSRTPQQGHSQETRQLRPASAAHVTRATHTGNETQHQPGNIARPSPTAPQTPSHLRDHVRIIFAAYFIPANHQGSRHGRTCNICGNGPLPTYNLGSRRPMAMPDCLAASFAANLNALLSIGRREISAAASGCWRKNCSKGMCPSEYCSG